MVFAVNWPPQAPGPGTGRSFHGFELIVRDLAGGMRTDGFKYVLDGDIDERAVGLLQLARSNGAAVEHEAGDIQAAHGHDGAGHVFVTASDTDDAVEEVAARYQLDRVGDDLA